MVWQEYNGYALRFGVPLILISWGLVYVAFGLTAGLSFVIGGRFTSLVWSLTAFGHAILFITAGLMLYRGIWQLGVWMVIAIGAIVAFVWPYMDRVLFDVVKVEGWLSLPANALEYGELLLYGGIFSGLRLAVVSQVALALLGLIAVMKVTSLGRE